MIFMLVGIVVYIVAGYVFAWSMSYLEHIPRADVHVVAVTWPPYAVMFIRGEYQ